MTMQVRRVVTGHEPDGKAVVLFDGPPTKIRERPGDSEVRLKAGDVFVQQRTNHAWVNHGAGPCRIAFVLMDVQEPL